MKLKLALVIFLVGCSATKETKLNRESLHYVAANDWTQWAPMVKAAPTYPSSLLARGIEGCVNVEFIVNEHGKPIEPVVTKSFPAGAFDSVSLDALRKFKYEATPNNQIKTPIVTSNIFTFSHPSAKPQKSRAFWESKCK
jgi:TonB family protein